MLALSSTTQLNIRRALYRAASLSTALGSPQTNIELLCISHVGAPARRICIANFTGWIRQYLTSREAELPRPRHHRVVW